MTEDRFKAQADWFFAFGDPNRIAIVRALATGEKIVTDLAKLLKVELVNVYHLKLLKAAGIVTVERDGRFQRYRLLDATATAVAIEMTHESGAKVTLPLN